MEGNSRDQNDNYNFSYSFSIQSCDDDNDNNETGICHVSQTKLQLASNPSFIAPNSSFQNISSFKDDSKNNFKNKLPKLTTDNFSNATSTTNTASASWKFLTVKGDVVLSRDKSLTSYEPSSPLSQTTPYDYRYEDAFFVDKNNYEFLKKGHQQTFINLNDIDDVPTPYTKDEYKQSRIRQKYFSNRIKRMMLFYVECVKWFLKLPIRFFQWLIDLPHALFVFLIDRLLRILQITINLLFPKVKIR